mmetsp:Transcript_13493/g.32149  ORF Transcript_13493/g.32149 Transcript_13493/m.32149 type:complete len:432 (+) Transcript_13493:15-1310(+)
MLSSSPPPHPSLGLSPRKALKTRSAALHPAGDLLARLGCLLVALRCGLLQPVRRPLLVLRDSIPRLKHQPKVVLRVHVALVGSLLKPVRCPLAVLLHAVAREQHRAHEVLRILEAVAGGRGGPIRGVFGVDLHAEAKLEHPGNLVLRARIVLLRSLVQPVRRPLLLLHRLLRRVQEHGAEHKLGVDDAQLGRGTQVGGALVHVLRYSIPLKGHHGKEVLGHRLALLGSLLQPGCSLRRVLLHPVARDEHHAQVVLRGGEALLGGLGEPLRGLQGVPLPALLLVDGHPADVELGLGVASLSRADEELELLPLECCPPRHPPAGTPERACSSEASPAYQRPSSRPSQAGWHCQRHSATQQRRKHQGRHARGGEAAEARLSPAAACSCRSPTQGGHSRCGGRRQGQGRRARLACGGHGAAAQQPHKGLHLGTGP